ncbi:glycoside hydrolase family 6 protein [Saccharothrix coeruleofusca]|uniref:glycoside hydrolase family 6 protein n=1 Tax=Saccharothrix coeruleofusca TaxID=33919 RepID=UPI0023EEF49D|nr:glycoside hydrolase family 6 protein [Saccharothrix coeruleofusca]
MSARVLRPSRLGRASAALLLVTALAGWPAAATGTARVDNPYAGARVYVNPEWSARAAREPGGSAVANLPTGVWLDRIASIEGFSGRMGLRDHLDEALRQEADLVQLVLHNLPQRDCGRLSTNGELDVRELPRYRQEFIDPIAEILADPAYARLRVVVVVEHDSLPFLVTHTIPANLATPECDRVKETGVYVEGVGYALAKLGAIPNVYNYLDIAHHGWLGWASDRLPAAEVFAAAARAAGSTPANVHGFIANTADYSVLREEYFSRDDVVGGRPVLQSRWVDWNDFVDELSYARRFRAELVEAGFDPGVGVLVDTSRNGWGGPNRPTGPGPKTGVDDYVDGSRLDRRARIYNWCNQVGAGLGERPVAAPEPGVDAYVWMKPPGVSDGASIPLPTGEDNFNPMCDPSYTGSPDATPDPTGARPDAPPAGAWFSAHFQELLRNAHPPL